MTARLGPARTKRHQGRKNVHKNWIRRALPLLIALTMLAAACGSDSDEPAANGTGNGSEGTGNNGGDGPEPDFDPSGVLRLAADIEPPGGFNLDPAAAGSISDEAWLRPIYGTLLAETPEGEYVPWMVESFEVVDPQTIRLTTREGMEFSDGTPFDAEAVSRGLERTRFEPATAAAEANQTAIFRQLESVDIIDESTVELKLASPVAGAFIQVLAAKEGAIVSPTAADDDSIDLNTAPVGAGPFVFDSHRPAQLLALRKNPTYFDAENFRLGGLDLVHSPAGPGRVSGLLAGEVDFAQVPVTDQARIEGAANMSFTTTMTDYAYHFVNFCRAEPPFDDVRVRQAVQKAIDRDEVNDLLQGGAGSPAHGMWPIGHQYLSDEVVEIAQYDPDGARALLEDAGLTNLEFELYFPTNIAASPPLAEILQAQLARVGITMVPVAANDIINQFLEPQIAGAITLPGSRTGVDKLTTPFGAESFQNICRVETPEVIDKVDEIASLDPTDSRVGDLYREIDLLIAEEALLIPVIYAPTGQAWNSDRVGGEPAFSAQRNILDYSSIYITR